MDEIEEFCGDTLSEADKITKELQEILMKAQALNLALKLLNGPPDKIYFFGHAGEHDHSGHQIYWRPFHSLSRSDMQVNGVPWSLGELDGQLAPVLNPWCKDHYRRQECPQGVTSVTYKKGWTALSFWDRTGDSRGASNSTFLINRPVDFKEGIELAQASWPQLFKRFQEAGLELKEYEGT